MWGLEWLSLSGLFSKGTQESHHTAKALEAERPQPKINRGVPDEDTESSASNRLGQEHISPFLRLPVELWVMIYDFAQRIP